MREWFDDDVRTVSVTCSECGQSLELASTALGLFESEDKVLCLECLMRVGESTTRTLGIEERIALIDLVVDDFSSRLRNILLRSVRPDLSWNNSFGFEDWSDPGDSAVAAHAPGIWYAGKAAAEARRRGAQ